MAKCGFAMVIECQVGCDDDYDDDDYDDDEDDDEGSIGKERASQEMTGV